jgi:hypothetical protein
MMPGMKGEAWSWGSEEEGTFKRGLNLHVKLVCYDLHHDGVTAADPWIVSRAGDAARVSQRGTIITTRGAKGVDRRLSSQEGTGKAMNQSRSLCAPTLAGRAKEDELMPHFHDLVAAFKEIEDRGFVAVDGVECEVPTKVVVVAEMSFVWKHAGRRSASGSGCFCWLCKVHANTRHVGCPGGCLKCRDEGTVHGLDGRQACLHWDPHAPGFGLWEQRRCQCLEANVKVPLSVRPKWNDAATPREECELRCSSSDKSLLKKTTTMVKLEKFLLARCRGGAELTANVAVGVRACDMNVVQEDLKERGVATAGMDEGTTRKALETRLRLEDEKQQMKLLMGDDTRCNKTPEKVSDDIEPVLIDTLHAPTRMNEKVLYMLCSKACDNKSKKQAAATLAAMTTKLGALGSLGAGWRVQFNETNSEKIPTFALPHDQSKKIFTKRQLPGLREVIDLACGNKNDGHHAGSCSSAPCSSCAVGCRAGLKPDPAPCCTEGDTREACH